MFSNGNQTERVFLFCFVFFLDWHFAFTVISKKRIRVVACIQFINFSFWVVLHSVCTTVQLFEEHLGRFQVWLLPIKLQWTPVYHFFFCWHKLCSNGTDAQESNYVIVGRVYVWKVSKSFSDCCAIGIPISNAWVTQFLYFLSNSCWLSLCFKVIIASICWNSIFTFPFSVITI